MTGTGNTKKMLNALTEWALANNTMTTKKKRTLKIEERGDFHAKETIPTIRLKGKWLRAAGFAPGATVELTAVAPGVIEIRVNPPAQKAGEHFAILAKMDAAIARHDEQQKAK